MRVALIQTKQNSLYSFHQPDFRISYGDARLLQEEMIEQCFQLARGATDASCDLIVTPEAINFCGTGKALGGSCEPLIPLFPDAPFFGELAGLAKMAGSFLVAGAYHKRYNREGKLLCYNSAFVYDREGKLRAVYDKIHLAGSELGDVAPGKEVVVVETDMGKMGLAVCYDMQFEDVCASCRKKGAEFMAVPTWGWEHGYGMRRIQETGMGMAVAMSVPYWMPIQGLRSPSELVDGSGHILAAAGCSGAELLIGELLLDAGSTKNKEEWRK